MNLQVKVKNTFQGEPSNLVQDLSVSYLTPRYVYVAGTIWPATARHFFQNPISGR